MEYTRYEEARILGARSLQIAMGAPAFVDVDSEDSPIDIAKREMDESKLPITVRK
ncbi:MAG: DNA-directed RNA polymerase subunit K [Candidatus Nanohaloarchaea archaeon]